MLANFLEVFCDGSTDEGITEQEVVYVIFIDPESRLPALKFFHIIAPFVSQHATGLNQAVTDSLLKQAITDSFKDNSLESAL